MVSENGQLLTGASRRRGWGKSWVRKEGVGRPRPSRDAETYSSVLTALICVQVRRLGAVHRYTVQCVLPINLFNEKIYLFLWFWMVFVAFVTCMSTLSWFARIVVHKSRQQYVRRYVNLAVKLKVSRQRSRASHCSFLLVV